MVALMSVLAIVAVLAGIFATLIRQMAGARRRQYLDEVAADSLACTSLPELEQRAERQKAHPSRPTMISRKRIHNRLARHPHTSLITR
jgi:hypothetical protein